MPLHQLAPPLHHVASPPQAQRGAAAIESTLSILLLLLVATAVLEFAYWGVVRQLCRQALQDSLRVAVSANGTPHALEHAFETARHSRLTQTWSLQILQPDPGTWSDFQDPFLSAQQVRPVIRNDSQREQHQRHLTRWADGKGPASGKTIFEANLLQVELTYHHRLLSPWFRHWLGATPTRLTLQAAMQSDLHGGAHIRSTLRDPSLLSGHHRDHQKHLNPHTLTRQPEIDSALHPHFKERKGTAQPLKDKQSITPWEINKPVNTSLNTKGSVLPLHPDLVEQCGTLMCCSNP